MEVYLLLALLAPFALAFLMPALGSRLGHRVGWVALVAPLLSLFSIITLWQWPATDVKSVSWSWVPSLGAALTFNPDGLALFFGLVVSGVGVLVVAYAASYLDSHYKDHGRFYCYLLLFMGAMLATVFSSNLLVLFVAWELTGLTSFLLIGFLHENETSRRGARMALLTTGLTGLALLAGVVLLRLAYGSFELAEILARVAPGGAGVVEGRESLVLAAFVCCFVGIAGKSAQFPFHYWLPNAMAAPTPVSAYLHSATMVKLGVFLTARLLPVFAELPQWTPVLVSVGFFTLFLGSVLALLSHDLKGVLAYTTVAQLGLLIGHYGLYAQGGQVTWDYVHILNHVFYKASLFMVVGIIDHSTGTRDLRDLGGLARRMPVTAFAAAISLASLAGLPFTTGFLSKEMLLKSLTDFWSRDQGGALALFAVGATLLASIVKVAIAGGVWRRAFQGTMNPSIAHHFHAPSWGLQLPPLLLSLAALGLGVASVSFGDFANSFYVEGLQRAPALVGELHLWHGVTLELMLSLGVFVLGGLLFGLLQKAGWARLSIPSMAKVDELFDPLLEKVQKAGKRVNRSLGFDTPYAHLFVIAGVMIAVVLWVAVPQWKTLLGRAELWTPWSAEFGVMERWVVVGLAGGAAVAAAYWKNPLLQVIALCVVGLGVTVYYVLYSAPDLALTQLLVETATLLLVLFVVLRFKRDGADRAPLAPLSRLAQGGRVSLAALFGLLLGGGVLFFQSPRNGEAAFEYAGDWYLAQSVPLAKGTNAVNTVVIDFRGWDTFLEITVLVVAALGCLGLLHRARQARETEKSASRMSGDKELLPVPHDLILRMVVLGAFIPLNVFALHLFLRGHNAPGGGFIAGLVSAISVLLLTFAIGVQGTRRLLRFNPFTLAVVGVLLSLAVALWPTWQGLPLFAHFHAYLPGGFYVGSPFWFDLGVYFTVVGSVLKLILPLMKSVHAMPAFVKEEEGRFAEKHSEPIDLPSTTDAKNTEASS